MGYKYYDTPEGDDCFSKLWYTSKIATVAGLGISTFDILFHSHPKGYYQTATRYAYFTVPIIGMAAAFTATACAANSLRKTDDKLNYFLGGCASGAVFGTWQRSKILGFIGCAFLGTAAVLKKMSVDEGWEFSPKAKFHSNGTLLSVRHDFTLTAERPRNWKVSE